jgi:hypothetical protein
MAGTNPAFDATTFRDGIRFAMNMGLPSNVADRPTFYFTSTVTYPLGTPLDENGVPFDPTVAPSVTTPPFVRVPCAVETSIALADELPVGMFRKAKATLTLLDQDYQLVKDATEVSLGGDRYVISDSEPPLGMFDVTIYRLICFGKDEA